MSALLTKLTAVERLAAFSNQLPADFAKAVTEDLEYARFGAALVDLPRFGGWPLGGLEAWFRRGPPRMTALLRDRAPVTFGLKAAELVSNGALVGVEPGLSFVAGYFTQLCVARALEPGTQGLVTRFRRPRESFAQAKDRVELSGSLFLMQALYGSPLVGEPAIRMKLQVRKAAGPRGVSRGMYELIRVCSLEAFGEAPGKAEVDGWINGLYLYAVALSSPLGKLQLLGGAMAQAELYRGGGVDVFASVEEGLQQSRQALEVLSGFIRRNSFGARSRARFLELVPENPAALQRGQAA